MSGSPLCPTCGKPMEVKQTGTCPLCFETIEVSNLVKVAGLKVCTSCRQKASVEEEVEAYKTRAKLETDRLNRGLSRLKEDQELGKAIDEKARRNKAVLEAGKRR